MKHTIIRFKYDKGDGSSPKDRNVLVLSKPSDTFFGVEFIDAAELQPMLDYLAEKEVLENYLKSKYDLSGVNYKRFKQDKITRLTEEKI